VKQTRLLSLFLALILLAQCGSTEGVYEHDVAGTGHVYYEIDDDIEDDHAMSELIGPYVRDMARTMNRVLTVSEGPFERGHPEGALGNLSADIVRFRATAEMRRRVDISVMNNGGLRVPLPEGVITVGHIYELMPFENYIAVLRFSGEQIIQIANELAAVNGEAVSGIRFRIVDGSARDILIDSLSVDPDRHYWLATNNWMADGGGDAPTLWEPLERHNINILIRDAIIEYLRARESIAPFTDQRIRN
jgi:2',3'-cyclic-nucleotide 2'-phosphodiesterase (5'-nucleotidase family)